MPPVSHMSKTILALALAQSLAVPVAEAAIINVDGSCSIQDAIRSANTDAVVSGCEAGSGDDTINIPFQTISLTSAAIDGEQFGPSGLPLISSNITILGNGSTIERPSGTEFRILATDSGTNAVLTMESVTLTGGIAKYGVSGGYGGAIYVGEDTSLILNAATISGNRSYGSGGGVYSYGATGVQINDSTIENNTADYIGGGVSSREDGLVKIDRTTIDGNTAGSGGGMSVFYTEGLVTVSDSTISNNILPVDNPTGGKGAGIVTYRGSLAVQNSTISSNTSSNSSSGLYLNASKSRVFNTTIANNQPATTIVTAGNPTYVNTLTLVNSVVVSPEASDTCYILGGNPAISVRQLENSNWFTDTTCDGIDDGDPLLGPLANNGGPTLTHGPTFNSPLIGAASSAACPDLDQRGADRESAGLFMPIKAQNGKFAIVSIDGECDIGAVEFVPM